VLLWLPSEPGATERFRVGVTVSSRVGNSVVRNRIKRWVREFLRRHKLGLPSGRMAVIAKTAASGCAHDVLDRDLGRLFARAGKR
jgi:ribonuclease P protein component